MAFQPLLPEDCSAGRTRAVEDHDGRCGSPALVSGDALSGALVLVAASALNTLSASDLRRDG